MFLSPQFCWCGLGDLLFSGGWASGEVSGCGWANGIGFALAAFDDGSVSLYLSNGGGVIGGGSNASVREAAERFLGAVDRARGAMIPAAGTDPPGPEHVMFWALTGEGNLSSGAVSVTGSSPYADAWKSGQETITQLRNLKH